MYVWRERERELIEIIPIPSIKSHHKQNTPLPHPLSSRKGERQKADKSREPKTLQKSRKRRWPQPEKNVSTNC